MMKINTLLPDRILLILFIFCLLLAGCQNDNNDVEPDDPVYVNPCPGMPTVSYAGKTYHTVQIGNQCWLRENLNIGNMIPSGQEQTNNGVIEKYCYDNNPDNCEAHGGLYQWDEIMQYTKGEKAQGICPPGFHIPSDDEFKILEGTVDTEFGIGNAEWDKLQWRGFDAGGHLKATGTDDWGAPNTGATNSSWFSALPNGYKENNANEFSGYPAYLTLWTSSEFDDLMVWRRALSYYFAQVYRSYHDKKFGYSLRCIRD